MINLFINSFITSSVNSPWTISVLYLLSPITTSIKLPTPDALTGVIDSDYRGELMAKFKVTTDAIPSGISTAISV